MEADYSDCNCPVLPDYLGRADIFFYCGKKWAVGSKHSETLVRGK